MVKKVIAISGSLRKASFNTSLLQGAQGLHPEVEVEIFDASSIPFFSQDTEQDVGNYPESVKNLVDAVRASDGLLLATTEYNFLPSAVIKNAVDWLSRGQTNSPLFGKKVALVSAGAMEGGINAQNSIFYALKRMKWLNIQLITDPVIALCMPWQNQSLFNKDMVLVSEEIKEKLKQILSQY